MDEIASRVEQGQVAPVAATAVELNKVSRAGGPVTCVSFVVPSEHDGDVARIWALGSYLFYSCGTVRSELLVFPQEVGGSIHGISFRERTGTADIAASESNWQAAVFGGRQLAFCQILHGAPVKITPPNRILHRLDIIQQERSEKPQLLFMASDWIWDVKLLQVQGTKTVTAALGLARHTVELWNLDSITTSPNKNDDADADDDDTSTVDLLCVTLQRRIAASPSCLVTSMNLLAQENRLWVAAGTAFQVIQVWSLPTQSNNKDTESDMTPDFRLEGHAGIIHSVRFSDDGRSIVSTSDDRSVRLWNTCGAPDGEKRQSHLWHAKWVGWGHTARVWSAAFLHEAVASVAEDATIRIWALESGVPLACIHHPSGLWSISTRKDVALVGATDGTVSMYNLSQRIPGRQLKVLESIAIPDDRSVQSTSQETSPSDESNSSSAPKLEKAKTKSSKSSSQVIVGMEWVGCDQILVATRTGSLMMWNSTNDEWAFCVKWWSPDLLASHGISATDGCCMAAMAPGWAAIGTTRGDIVAVNYNARISDGTTERMVLSGKPLRSAQGLEWIQGYHTLVSFHVQTVALWGFSDSDHVVTSMHQPTFILNVDTKGVPLCCAYDKDRNQMVVGDKRGNISLFQIPSSSVNGSMVEAASLLLRVHQKEHVTSVYLVGDRVVSSGNDGCLHTSYRNGLFLERGFSMPVSSLTGITRIWRQRSQNLVVAGYYGNLYRIVDVSTGYIFFQVDTGGRQRICDLSWPTENGTPGLKQLAVCMNQKDGTNSLLIHKEIERNESAMDLLPKTPEGIPVHGETIFDSCFFSLGKGDTSFLFTGSEDCGSKLFLCKKNHLEDAIALTPQESCVRAVCCSQVDEKSALLVVGGAKLILQFFLGRSIGGSCSSFDDIAIHFIGKRTNRQSASIDQRINTVKAVPMLGSDRIHLVVAGDSAGQCHVYIISEDLSVRPSLGIVEKAASRPILSIALNRIHDRILLVIGTTAGDVIVYDLPASAPDLNEHWEKVSNSPWSPITTFQTHQMGTNAISMLTTTTSDTTTCASILTAGDDQAITHCRLKVTSTSKDAALQAVLESSATIREASFSALKGIVLLPCTNSTLFVTAGYAQRISLWKLLEDVSGGESKLQIVKHLPVDVGDVNAVAACTTAHTVLAAVVGLGIELFTILNA